MKHKVSHTTKFNYSEPVPVGHNILHLAPRSWPDQAVASHRLLIRPNPIDLSYREDFFGNEIAYFSIDNPHRQLTVTATSEVDVSDRASIPLQQTPNWGILVNELGKRRDEKSLAALQFTLPSRHVQPFPALNDFCQAIFFSWATDWRRGDGLDVSVDVEPLEN